MTTTITVTNGIGSQAGRVGAYDRAAAFSITGLAAEFYNAAVTGEFTTADGATALASQATGTVSATGTVTLTFDTDTANMATLMDGRQQDADARLTVYATTGESNACIAAIKVSPAADHGTTVASSEDTPATLVQVAQEVAAHDADAEAHADLFASTVSWPTVDGSALADANRFAVGQLSGSTWTWVAKTGTQIKAWLQTWADGLYAGLTHKSRHATGGADALTAADIGAAASNVVTTHEGAYAHANIATAYAYHASGAALPASPVTGQVFQLTAQDATNKAGQGYYVHDGTGWTCLKCVTPYAWGNTGATPTLALIAGCEYIFTQDQAITSAVITLSRPGSCVFTKSGEYSFATPTATGRTVKTRTASGWTNAGAALVEGVFRDDGTYMWISAVEGA